MKTKRSVIIPLLGTLLIIFSCTDSDISELLTASSDSRELSLSTYSIKTGFSSYSTKITVNASYDFEWKFLNIPSWVSIVPSSGTGTTSVTVNVMLNSVASRSHTVTLTGKTGELEEGLSLQISQDQNPAGLIDLGLSVCWADMNIDASAVEEYGDYYAWGETETKDRYAWASYKWGNGSNNALTRYNYNEDYGTVDDRYKLELSDDVAHIKWGGNWRMPTNDEITELIDNCTWTWARVNGVRGYRVTSKIKGYTDKSIFFPAAGYKDSISTKETGTLGLYWSSSINYGNSKRANGLGFTESGYSVYNSNRNLGQVIRAVCKSDKWTGVTSMTLNESTLSMNTNDFYQLIAYQKIGDSDVKYPVTWSSDNESVAVVYSNGRIRTISAGVCTITGKTGSVSAECVLTVTKPDPVIEAVDLGLTVNWATCNVGAVSPEKAGGYYSWGEKAPKSYYSWDTYFWINGSNSSMRLTKYNANSVNGLVDNIYVLENSDDVATVEWGDGWYTPSESDFQELIDNCTWTWSTVGDVTGYLVTSNKSGYENASIFLPAAGYCYNGSRGSNLSYGYYWCSNVSNNNSFYARELVFYSSHYSIGNGARLYGENVRPVCSNISYVRLDETDLNLYAGDEYSLTPGIYSEKGLLDKVDDILEWQSDDPSVATVSSDGKVSAVSEGSCVITASARGKAVSCQVVVKNTTIEMSDSSVVILSGSTYTLNASVTSNGVAIDRKPKWESSNEGVATVDENGVVTSKSYGKCIIYASVGSLKVSCSVLVVLPVSEDVNSYTAINMGLSVKWATCNIGASTPEAHGNYYAWGETTTRYSYVWDYYKHCNYGLYDSLTKYCTSSSYGSWSFTDNKTVLEAGDDAATELWGPLWRIPTIDEIMELWFNCTWTEENINGVNGYRVTSNVEGYTDRSIFIPVSGYRYDVYSYNEDQCFYWSSSLYASTPSFAKCLHLPQDHDHSVFTTYNYSRCYGMVIRPVSDNRK